uniref:CRAL-TRIO domain-containing protein n=1 Tax=Panagrolaimus sp. JU765 TaxID=591449 RepID=A0AC34QJT8_9BILA
MWQLSAQESIWLANLRQQCAAQIAASEKVSDYCENPFNLLRWVHAYEGDEELAAKKLSRHLRIREILRLDETECWDSDIVDHEADNYAPWNILGKISEEDRRILVIEQSGRFDLQTMMKSIRTTPFMRNRFRNMESVLSQIGLEEKIDKKMKSAVFVIDLEGLSFQPNLISFISGSYRILWGTLIEQYPFLISQILIVNPPAFMSVLWNACSAFIPAEYRKKIKLLGNDWRNEILSFLPASSLPEQYSGILSDQLIKPPTTCQIPIPRVELALDTLLLDSLVVPAGGFVVQTFLLAEHEQLEFFMKHEQEFTMNIFFHKERRQIRDSKNMDDFLEVYAGCERPGIPTLDYWKWTVPKTGYYYAIYGNEKAWIMSVEFKYQIFRNQNGMKVKVNPVS